MPRPARLLVLATALALFLVPPASPQPAPHAPLDLDRGATGLGLALRRLGVTARVLYVTAHPDDEHNGVLVRLARGEGVRTALLTITRGEGGQNAIGPELFTALGVLRTAELESMHRYDGAEQYFGRAYEFGYSFSVEETFAKWGREETLGDVVRVVRSFRPDVILTLPLEGTGGGQHHQAAGRLARDAFRAAADPQRFPEQLQQGLRPWQARKVYVGGVGGTAESTAGVPVHLPTGVYDPLLGQTWEQLGSRARALQRCQGTRQLVALPGPAEGVYSLLDAEPRPAAGGAVEGDILDGIDPSLAGLARFAPAASDLGAALRAAEPALAAARRSFDATAPDRAAAPLAAALTAVRALESRLASLVADPAARLEVAERLRDEEADAEDALALAQGLEVDALADDGLVTPGQTFGVAVSVSQAAEAAREVDDVSLEVPAGWSVEAASSAGGPVTAGASRTARFRVTVAADAPPTQPYWRRMSDRDRHELVAPADETLPWSPPAVVARVRARIAGVETTRRASVAWRYDGPVVGGEKRHPVQVVPALSVRVSPEIVPVPLAAPRPVEVRVFVRSFAAGAVDGTVRLDAPAGWRATPATAPVRFAYDGAEAAARFTLAPSAPLAAGPLVVRAVAQVAGRDYGETLQVVEYPHVERRPLLRPAEVRLLALPVRTRPGATVGYVMGSGDAVADAIRELGVEVTLLSGEDLAFGDLSRFGTIVTGIRAYETREDLRAAHPRLMRWVEAGGHLVVQYNRDAFNRLAPGGGRRPSGAFAPSPFVPYPAAVTSERISDETAPMRVLAPSHPLLLTPNRIGDADWSGWVQERGIQLLDARDPRYVELLASTDPFPYNPGEKKGLLVDAAVGRGTWTYVGLVLFRQVPAGVPGGWRLLANLVSR